MSLHSIAAFLHVLGALGLFAALGLEWAAVQNLRRAVTTGQVLEWVRLMGARRFVGGVSALTLLVTGIYLRATWGGQAWIGLGFLGLLLVAGLGGPITGRRMREVAGALPAEDGPTPAALGRRLRDPVLTISLWLRTALSLGIVFIMTTKPGSAGAASAMGIALLLGLAAAIPVRMSQRGFGEA
jgi:hypothetical protein